MHDMGISSGLTCFSLIDRRRSEGGAEGDNELGDVEEINCRNLKSERFYQARDIL